MFINFATFLVRARSIFTIFVNVISSLKVNALFAYKIMYSASTLIISACFYYLVEKKKTFIKVKKIAIDCGLHHSINKFLIYFIFDQDQKLKI